MRDLIVIVVIILIVFGGGFFSECYLEKSEKELTEMINNIHTQINNGDMEHLDEVYRLQRMWDNNKPYWHVFANHQEIDEIEAELARFTEAYKHGLADEAKLSTAIIVFRINDMHKGEKLELANIL